MPALLQLDVAIFASGWVKVVSDDLLEAFGFAQQWSAENPQHVRHLR